MIVTLPLGAFTAGLWLPCVCAVCARLGAAGPTRSSPATATKVRIAAISRLPAGGRRRPILDPDTAARVDRRRLTAFRAHRARGRRRARRRGGGRDVRRRA